MLRTLYLVVTLCCTLGSTLTQGDSVEDIDVYGDSEEVLMSHPVAINAHRMSKAVKLQDAVSTCRYILFKTWKTFNEARESCLKLEMPLTLRRSGSMATVKNEVENRDMVILLKTAFGVKRVNGKYYRDNWVWLGLRKIYNNEVVLPKNMRGEKSFNASEWQWLDGSTPTYWRWQNKMPDQDKRKGYPGYQNYVALGKDGRWDDTFETMKMPYACNYCGKYIVLAKHVSWTTARDLCESYGLTMAKINSKEDNEDLDAAAKMTLGEYTDPKRWNDTNWIWIGTREVMYSNGTGSNVWQHHDGTPLLWETPDWDYKRQPDNYVKPRGEEQVVAFSRIKQEVG